jgi:hypothetical protein
MRIPSFKSRFGAALLLMLAASALAAPEALAQGCSMCRTAVGDAADPLAKALSWSSLFMVSMPFAIFASIAGWLAVSIRRRGIPAAEEGWAPVAPRGAAAGAEAENRGPGGHR